MAMLKTQIVPQAFREKHAYPAIPEATDDPASLHQAVKALTEVVETLTGRRGPPQATAVTYRDLVLMGLMAQQDVPKDGGPPRTV